MVILMSGAEMNIVDDEVRMSDPKPQMVRISRTRGHHILINGGFFILGDDIYSRRHNGDDSPQRLMLDDDDIHGDRLETYVGRSVGATSLGHRIVQSVDEHRNYNERLVGNGPVPSFLTSAPSLKNRLNPNEHPELQFKVRSGPNQGRRSKYSFNPGGLATADQPNERQAIVNVDNNFRLIFTYTAREREVGVALDTFRDIINVFLDNTISHRSIT